MQYLEPFATLSGWISLLSLTTLEIVLGVDNLVFVALATQGLPPDKRGFAARLGLGFAVVFRLALLSGMFLLAHLTRVLVTVMGHGLTGRDIILFCGGLFLLYKGTEEIHEALVPDDPDGQGGAPAKSMLSAIVQIAALDMIFSLDSVMTALGMADDLEIMAAAVVISIMMMMAAAAPLSRFIHDNPTVKMLALSFLLLIGMTLLADSFGYPVPKGFIYAAIGFSVLVELLNQMSSRARRRAREARAKPQEPEQQAPEQQDREPHDPEPHDPEQQ